MTQGAFQVIEGIVMVALEQSELQSAEEGWEQQKHARKEEYADIRP